ncbi:MAG: DUF4097 family beta strand repeat-containing protein [Sporolactobacillus sp.]|uniref:DUF4097 family beta strand repeat-containing protein n=1 Tax=Sporolactobacillus sp. STSJ-5 TaxID=2965076 RepID=UPI002102730F|nr:DUF4097 family beta strand repeat-containing protein [Sporolactobacillus sp. STSJ-5]MCQ2010875.1 DUF4097 domain-containing protein [Sporolactobacillus sp. STSJ-5]
MRNVLEETVDMDGIDDLIVNTSSTDVELIQTEETVLKAQVWTGDLDEQNCPVELVMNKKDDKLEIHIIRNRQDWLTRLKTLSFANVKVVIELPTRLYDHIVIDGQSSDISAFELVTNRMNFSCRSGDIELMHCAANQELNATTSSGDLTICDTHVKERLNANTSSGDVRLNKSSADDLRLLTHSGDITVTDCCGDLDASASSGDIDLTSDELAGDLNLETSSGDVTVTFGDEPDSVSVYYQGSSGDGSVHFKDMLYKEKSDHHIIGKKGDGKYKIKARTSSGDFSLK